MPLEITDNNTKFSLNGFTITLKSKESWHVFCHSALIPNNPTKYLEFRYELYGKFHLSQIPHQCGVVLLSNMGWMKWTKQLHDLVEAICRQAGYSAILVSGNPLTWKNFLRGRTKRDYKPAGEAFKNTRTCMQVQFLLRIL